MTHKNEEKCAMFGKVCTLFFLIQLALYLKTRKISLIKNTKY